MNVYVAQCVEPDRDTDRIVGIYQEGNDAICAVIAFWDNLIEDNPTTLEGTHITWKVVDGDLWGTVNGGWMTKFLIQSWEVR